MSGVSVGRVLVESGWNPTTTIRFSRAFPQDWDYAERLLGEVVAAPLLGHDGKFYFAQAMDPFYFEPEAHAIHLDRPTYRAQRMLYPTLAGAGGLLGPRETSWGLIAVNVLAMGAGTALTGALAMNMGRSPWLGVAFVVNPGHLAALGLDTAEIVASTALMGGTLAVARGRLGWAGLALCAAGLARETMIIGAGGIAARMVFHERRLRWEVGAPFVAVGLWWVYVRWRLADRVLQDTRAVDLPFRGVVEAWQGWSARPGLEIDLLFAILLLLVSGLIAIRAATAPSVLGSSVAGFAALAVVMSAPVWEKYTDSTRALAPVITAYVLLVWPQAGRRRGLPE